jgi:antitoxin PrlF
MGWPCSEGAMYARSSSSSSSVFGLHLARPARKNAPLLDKGEKVQAANAMRLHYHVDINRLQECRQMPVTLEADSSLTDRYQTTVPEPVRRVLKLRKRDRLHYVVRDNGEVLLSRAVPVDEAEDPALAPFLALLARDMASNPQRLQAVGPELAQRIHALVGDLDVDLDAPLSADNE